MRQIGQDWCGDYGRPCRKLKLEHIDDVARPRSAPKVRGQLPAPRVVLVRPCAETSACAPRCSISGMNVADGEGVVRPAQPRGQGSPAGWIRLVSRRRRFATVTAAILGGLGCPSP